MTMPYAKPTEGEHMLAASLVGTEPINHPELQWALTHRIADALAAERRRLMEAARDVVERETSAYPDASPAVTSGIWGAFDQWAAGVIDGTASCRYCNSLGPCSCEDAADWQSTGGY